MRKIAILICFVFPVIVSAQSLTIEKIMQDPKWIGTSPSAPFWDADGKNLYFYWNPTNDPADSLYFINEANKTPQKASIQQKKDLVSFRSLQFNNNKSAAVYSKNGDIFYKDLKKNKTLQITNTIDFEYGAIFSFNDSKVIYTRDQNLYAWDIASGTTVQLTNIQKNKPSPPSPLPGQEKWLQDDQLSYLEVLKERKEKREATSAYNKNLAPDELRKIYTNGDRVQQLTISPDGNYISYVLFKPASESKRTIIPDYVTESGFTTDIPGRTKVGNSQGLSTFYIYDRNADTVFKISTDSLKGIQDLPDYTKDYPNKKWEKKNRPVSFNAISWSPDGKNLVLDIRSNDFKDRWLVKWTPAGLQLLDRQRDEAWIGGPGSWNLDWIDNETIWFQSEATGYSHLYSINVNTGVKKAITQGKYEVQQAQLSNDHKYFYIITNEVHPGEKQFYRLQITDGKKERLTHQIGGYDAVLSPDEKYIALLYSYSNKPPELYLQRNSANAKSEQITFQSQSKEFQTYPWRDPEVLTFSARDGASVYARLYKPKNAKPGMPAVIFVHGAGYLQNAHKWWSTYFREYMFHNFLADNGYYVMDIDYRGSAGYGRDWRTGIYRHMGGKDLTDNVDAADFLVKNYGVDASSIGIYGGSYGGFITLMAMFTTPDVFAAGAGLRSVTDWANYNHGYTARILNEPVNDSIAYHRSSPIYFAEGLKGHLLMCHGMVDVNVHFQDIVKLSQRLIELKKENWELAVYPMEDHGFEEPTSWMDEYKRIFKLFENVLKKGK